MAPELSVLGLGVPGEIGDGDQERRIGAHDRVELRDDAPCQHRGRWLGGRARILEAARGHTAVLGRGPDDDSESGKRHDERLDAEEMLDPGGVDEEKREGEQESQEEADHDLCGDMLARRNAVVNLLPAREDAS